MIKKTLRAFHLLCLSLLLTVSAFAQCKDPLCPGLQNIFDAALTDFRAYRANGAAASALSTEGAKVPCQMSTWANNVPMYICYAQIPYASAEIWYTNALASIRILQPAWQFKIDSPVADHFVDAGLPDCSLPGTDGPYLGHCPLHLQITKQTDGTAKLYLWMSSLSSPYLVNRPPGPPPKAAPAPLPAVATISARVLRRPSRLAQALSKISALQMQALVRPKPQSNSPGRQSVRSTRSQSLSSNELGTQYVCYWQEASASAADTRFRDLGSRLQILAPSNWVIRQDDQSEELTGAKVKAWCAVAPDNKQEMCSYISGESVGLHLKTWK